jgi:SAM-dependent methyltransferase
MEIPLLLCTVCGNGEFRDSNVLWPRLIADWDLSSTEVAYIDRQQGTQCTRCGSNLREIALANAIREAVATPETLVGFVDTSDARRLHILDINGSSLSATLSGLPLYTRADYPSVDMQSMPYEDGLFDLVIHSDTLEHVPFPIEALRECGRVLSDDGFLCYTVPTIVARLTRDREGLPPSYHGDPSQGGYDFMVHTEFGADAWTFPIQAGFTSVTINTVSYPDATAITARKKLFMI